MKNLFIILLSMLSVIVLGAQAQTKKPVAKTATTSKTTPSSVKPSTSYYKTALGLKFIYGVSFTGKFFIRENAALEGILRYNGAGGLGSNIAFSGLYEHHADVKSLAGLRWYVGGGGHVNYFSYKGGGYDAVTTFGVVGILGLEYKIKNLPLAISADWQPGYIISSHIGFSAENGGLGVKYTF